MTKKSFKDNPALQFISAVEEERKIPSQQKNCYVEIKSRRLQLILKPSLFERVKKAASKKRISVNEYVHRVLDKATRED